MLPHPARAGQAKRVAGLYGVGEFSFMFGQPDPLTYQLAFRLTSGEPRGQPPPGQVFLSYAHRDGRPLALLIVEQLRAHGCRVSWDQDLHKINTPSIPEWMQDQIAGNIVICVLSSEYCARFGRGDDRPDSKGVLYESRLIQQKILNHTRPADCPVIPVSPGECRQAQIPRALQGILVTSINPVSFAGIDELIHRIRALATSPRADGHTSGEPGAVTGHRPADPESDPAESVRRRLLCGLEEGRASTLVALAAVQLWLGYCQRSADGETMLLGQGFDHAARIVKSFGDLPLMKQVSDSCWAAASRSDRPLTIEIALQARILVHGISWCRQRDHRLPDAITAVREGMDLARRSGDRRTEAFGRKYHGWLEGLLAVDARTKSEALLHLDISHRWLEEARQMFAGLDGDDSAEVGACLGLQARSALVRYQLTKGQRCLVEADELAVQADCIPADHLEYPEHVMLRCEIDMERHRYPSARRRLDQLADILRKRFGTQQSEVLARALRLRGILAYTASRRDWAAAFENLEEARCMFSALGQESAACECSWQQFMSKPSLTKIPRITQKELSDLEFLAPDPKRRIKAVERFYEREQGRVGQPVGRRFTWELVLRELDYETGS